MDNDKQQIAKCIESFYNIKITNEHTSGCSHNFTFEAEKDGQPLFFKSIGTQR